MSRPFALLDMQAKRYDKCLTKLSAAQEFVASLPDDDKHTYLVTVESMTGNVYFDQEDWTQALGHYKQALVAAEQL